MFTQGFVAIPKSVSRERIQENAQIFDFELDAGDMQQVRVSRGRPAPDVFSFFPFWRRRADRRGVGSCRWMRWMSTS